MSTKSDDPNPKSFAVQQTPAQLRNLLKVIDKNLAFARPKSALNVGEERVRMPTRDDLTIVFEYQNTRNSCEVNLRIKWHERDDESVTPQPINSLPRIEEVAQDLELKLKLTKAGIRHPLDLVHKCDERGGLEQLASNTGISRETLERLRGISELTQITPIQGYTAKILWETGVKSASQLSTMTATQLLDQLKTAKTPALTKGRLQVSHAWVRPTQTTDS